MNTTTSQPMTLQDAIVAQVNEFAKNNQPFSVHDITRTIREQVNNGNLEIPEVEVQGASFKFEIQHSKVKDIFTSLFAQGFFSPTFSLSRQFNGTYYEYTPTAVVPAAATPAVSVAQPPISVVPSATNTSNNSAIVSRIQTYLNNCKAKSFRPTLKQVQSAIKRGNESTGLTCEDIRNIVVNDLQLSVTDNPDYLSSSQVCI